MASGCDFVCKNKECKNYDTGIVITAPWPMGDIDTVIASSRISNNNTAKEGLLKLKNEGRKYACIAFPDKDNIPVTAYRVHLWCHKCIKLWTYDAPIINGETDLNKIIESANIPSQCPTCNDNLRSFHDLLKKDENINNEGIICPSCNTKLRTNTWFCNEKE